MHDLIVVHGAEIGDQMLVTLAVVVIVMNGVKLLAKIENVLILGALAVGVSRIPAGVEQGMAHVVEELHHVLAAVCPISSLGVGLGAVFHQNVHAGFFHHGNESPVERLVLFKPFLLGQPLGASGVNHRILNAQFLADLNGAQGGGYEKFRLFGVGLEVVSALGVGLNELHSQAVGFLL